MLRALVAALLLSPVLLSPAGATTVAEPVSGFGSFSAPTAIGAGVDLITGTGNGNQFDNFVFTNLPSGAQTLTFAFAAPAGIDFSYSAGGQILYSLTPFSGPYHSLTGPVTTAGSFGVGYFNPAQTLSFALDAAFSGSLYVAVNFTYGANLQYSLSVPSNASPANPPSTVPLPAAGFLLLGGLAGMGVVGRRRGRAAVQS